MSYRRNFLFEFIDVYPDFSTFITVFVASLLQLVLGNSIRALIMTVSMMLPSFLVILPTNVAFKLAFRTRRPKRYYEEFRGRSVFEGSFPSFHSQFSSGEAATYVMGIYAFSARDVRLVATVVALITAGLASVVIAYSRVVVGMHYPKDVLGGYLLGLVIGVLTPYILSRLWMHIPLAFHIAMIAIFSAMIFALSRRQRRRRLSR